MSSMENRSKLGRLMGDFWNRKARENVTYYISTYRPYDQQDPEEFWKWGRILTDRYLAASNIPFTGEEVVLDLGCGIGRMTRALAGRFRLVYGLDVSDEMIRLARESLKDCANVRLELGNGTDLACFGDESFDFVFSYLTLQHIPTAAITQQYIREMGRVLKDGGRAYFQVNGAHPTLRALVRMRSRLRALGKVLRFPGLARPGEQPADTCRGSGPRELDHPAYQGSSISERQIRIACRDASLDIEDLQGIGSSLLWVRARRRRGTK